MVKLKSISITSSIKYLIAFIIVNLENIIFEEETKLIGNNIFLYYINLKTFTLKKFHHNHLKDILN